MSRRTFQNLVWASNVELQILMQKVNDYKIYSLMGFSKVDYLKYLQECKYLRSHGLKTQLQENIYKNADISKKADVNLLV